MATDATETVGFVGLGAIGAPLVESLLRADVPVVVYDLDADAVGRMVEAGAAAATSIPDLAGRARLISVCVPADAHVRAVLDGPEGLLAHLAPGAVIAIHSTVAPETTQWAADAARAVDVAVVEAAVTGGAAAASEGRSTFLLGGDPAAIEQLEPLLAACGDVRIHAGELGQASRLKLCINLQSYVTFMGVNEAASLATSLGLPLDALRTAMNANGQLGELTRGYMSLHDMPAAAVSDPGMQQFLAGYAAIIEKDLGLITELAAAAGVPVPAAELAGGNARRVYFLEDSP